MDSKSNKLCRNSERLAHFRKVFRPMREILGFLDIGCGNCKITEEIAKDILEHHSEIVIYGADIYEPDKFTPPPISIQYLQVTDHTIDLPDKSIDLITCFMSIHHFEDFHLMMKEISRILTSGGYLFFREHDVPRQNLRLKSYLNQLHEDYPDHTNTGQSINYWPRQELSDILCSTYNFKFLASSDYPLYIKNPQSIYHSLYIKL